MEKPISKTPHWKHNFFRTKSNNLDEQLELIIDNTALTKYLHRILDIDHGFQLGVLHYRDSMSVDVKYGLALYGETIKLYLSKPAPVSYPEDVLLIKPSSFSEISKSYLPSTALPASADLVSDLNSSLKRPQRHIKYIQPIRLI